MASTSCSTSTIFSTTLVTTQSLSTSVTSVTTPGTSQVITTTTSVCSSPTPPPGATITIPIVECPITTLTTTITGTPVVSVSSTVITVTETITTSTPVSTQTSCTTIPPQSTPTSTPTPTPTPTPTSSSPSDSASSPPDSSTTTTTGPSFTMVTFPDGQTVTSTSSAQPGPGQSPSLNNASAPHGSGKTGTIVGASVGAVVGVLVLGVLAWWFYRRRSRWDDIFEDEQDALRTRVVPMRKSQRLKRPTTSFELEPAPYHYGLVGATPAPSAVQVNSPPTFVSRGGHARLPSSPPQNPLSSPESGLAALPAGMLFEPYTAPSTSSSGAPPSQHLPPTTQQGLIDHLSTTGTEETSAAASRSYATSSNYGDMSRQERPDSLLQRGPSSTMSALPPPLQPTPLANEVVQPRQHESAAGPSALDRSLDQKIAPPSTESPVVIMHSDAGPAIQEHANTSQPPAPGPSTSRPAGDAPPAYSLA